MYLPRSRISQLYEHLFRTHHPLAPQVLILVALEPDALCACRILAALLKHDYIGHKIQPISGYDDLTRAGETMVSKMKTQNGGEGGTVVCLGVGGLVDMSSVLGLDVDGDGPDIAGGVEVWIIDARRPWNLGNVFGGDPLILPGDSNDNLTSRASQVNKGEIQRAYVRGQGGIIVYDDGDIEQELLQEREAYCALFEMGDVQDDYVSGDSDEEEDENILESTEVPQTNGRKRKSWSDDDELSDEEDQPPRRRRRDESSSSRSPSPSAIGANGHNYSGSPSIQVASTAPTKGPSERALRRQFHKERQRFNGVLHKYYSLGASYSEPISSILYSLADELGRDGNDILWHAIVGISSLELYGHTMTGVGISTPLEEGGSAGWGGERGERIRQELRDEVHRLNPPDPNDPGKETSRGEASGVIPTTARSPTDCSIRLSPEPRFLLIRHWSLYESMFHSPYLGSRLHIWTEQGRKRLHKLLAKMGVSLSQCKQSYTHMDMDLKKGLRQRLLSYAPVYGLDGLVPPAGRRKEGWGFVRCWGWKGCFSAIDVGVIVGAILEVGKHGIGNQDNGRSRDYRTSGNGATELADESGTLESEEWVSRFWEAYDALDNIDALKRALPVAQHLHRAILRTGTSIIEKRQIRHLKAFRMAVVKEGPDVALFTHPSALTKLALWVGEAIAEQERDQRGKVGRDGRPTPLVMAGLNEARGVFVVVGTGGGGGVNDFAARAQRKAKSEEKRRLQEAKEAEKQRKRQERHARMQEDGEEAEDDESEEEEEEDDGDDDDSNDDSDEESEDRKRNKFGNAFQEVVDETNARVRIDSFEHCVVEVKKEDLSGFLESLSMKVVVG